MTFSLGDLPAACRDGPEVWRTALSKGGTVMGSMSQVERRPTEDGSGTACPGSVQILGISGSLRAQSSNTELLRAVASLAPPGVAFVLFSGLDSLPYFNPDLDGPNVTPPSRIGDLRRRIRWADALLICSPEYAHGVPGALKNALDWLVSDPDILHKPVGLLNASPRASHAQASLAETLRTMSMTVTLGASIAVPVMGRQLSALAMTQDPDLAAALRGVLEALVGAATEYRALPQADGTP
jgi:chromate reductase